MKRTTVLYFSIIALGVLAAWAPNASAYSNFYGGCQNCHGDWFASNYVSNAAQDRASWNRSLHSGHQTFAGCTACHQQIGDSPQIDGQSGDGLGSCIGCHGRDEDTNNLGVGSGRGAGLRQHHWVNGVDCSGCHGDSNPASFTAVGENVPGLRYAALGIDPCNEGVFGVYGSDNDGDNLYDGNDPDCAPQAVCGNGILEEGEECDDGNTVNGDGCQADCMLPACGDNIVDAGEQCDDGNTVNGDGCQADCMLPICGDNIVDAGEQCDDGNSVNGDGCENDCTFTLSTGCYDADVPVITEMEYDRGDEKLHIQGRAPAGTIVIINAATGETLADNIGVREGKWEAEIKDVGRNLMTISVISSTGCTVDLEVTDRSYRRDDDDDHSDDRRRGRREYRRSDD